MRTLTTAVGTVKDSSIFTYFDFAAIYLPFSGGDVLQQILRVATAEIYVSPSLDFNEFTYKAFTGALGRPPLSSERADWLDALIAAVAISVADLKTAAADLIDALFALTEYTDLMHNDDQFVTDLYESYLGRVPDNGKQGWVDEIVAHDRATVQAAFRASSEFDERVSLLAEPTEYDSDVREMGDLTIADGASVDGVEFSLTNVENEYSNIIGQAGRRLYPAPAVVKRAFKLADGTFESVPMLEGFAKFSGVDADSAKVTIVSDCSPDGTDVVEEVTQRCINIYKGEGCDSPDTSPTCSRIKDDAVNGCASKMAAPQLVDISPPDNRPSFRGIIQPLVSTTPAGVGLGEDGVGPGGWPGDEYDPNNPRTRGRSYQFGL